MGDELLRDSDHDPINFRSQTLILPLLLPLIYRLGPESRSVCVVGVNADR